MNTKQKIKKTGFDTKLHSSQDGNTAKQQPTNHCNFYALTTNHIMTKLTNPNQDQRHKYHHLMMTSLDSEDDYRVLR